MIAGISRVLDAKFGYEIHMEEIKQGLNEPCFFITCLNPAVTPYPGKRYEREQRIIIYYFPELDTAAQAECNGIAEKLFWCLEEIEVSGGRIRGSKMRYEITDGVLHFYADYNFFVRKGRNIANMENMNHRDTSVRG